MKASFGEAVYSVVDENLSNFRNLFEHKSTGLGNFIVTLFKAQKSASEDKWWKSNVMVYADLFTKMVVLLKL